MPKQKITEDALLARIQSEITDSLGYSDEISKQREIAMEYYYGLPFGNEVEGRSSFVDTTVQRGLTPDGGLVRHCVTTRPALCLQSECIR